MIILGAVLLILGLVLGFGLLVTIGIIAIVVGLVLTLLGRSGRPVGGRNTWY